MSQRANPKPANRQRSSSHRPRLMAIVLAAAMFSGGCGSLGGESDPSSQVVTEGTTPSTHDPSAPAESIEGSGLVSCDEVEKISSRTRGPLRTTQNYPPGIQSAVWNYGIQHPGEFGGYWLDRDNGGTIVVGFTGELEAHRAALLALTPSNDDEPPNDTRPLGMRDDVVIEVARVEFTFDDLQSAQERISAALFRRDVGLWGLGIDMSRNRVSLDLANPPPGAVAEIVRAVPEPPGLGAVCAELTVTAAPPEGPLELIPQSGVQDALVTCGGLPAMPYSEFIAPRPVDEVEHPAVDEFRAELEARRENPDPRPLPQGDWVVVHIGEDLVYFAWEGGPGRETAVVERRGDGWFWAGESAGPPCEPALALPEGLARVEVHFDPDAPPGLDDTEIALLVTERGCASGRDMGEALRGPQVVETSDAVLVVFAVEPVVGGADCPDNPSTAVTITLSEPLGERIVYDGLFIPPQAIVAQPR